MCLLGPLGLLGLEVGARRFFVGQHVFRGTKGDCRVVRLRRTPRNDGVEGERAIKKK